MSLQETLTAQREQQLRRAARALLRRPLLRAQGSTADDFKLVRTHAAQLRAWFERNTGWQLYVDAEVARLRRIPGSDADPTHPALDPKTGLEFSRRRYVLLCLALAVLERSEAQIALGWLAEQVVLSCADPAFATTGTHFALDEREQRTDLVAVVRLLLDLGVLAKVAGDEDAFLKESGDVLYDVERRVLAGMLACRRGPSTVAAPGFADRLAALNAQVLPDSDDLRNRELRHRLTRRLLDDPVVYHEELTEAERAYLASQRGQIAQRISALTGLVPEARAEGLAMVDPEDDLTDLRMPEAGTDGHVTLLVAEYLAAQQRAVPVFQLTAHVRRIAGEYAGFWRRSAQEPGAEAALVATALDRLSALGLVTVTEVDGRPAVLARPALARYAVAEATLLERGQRAAPRRSAKNPLKRTVTR
ncbi:TIGR02678 family protein [Actinocrinis puniceicyclus]|uniref:TIGR02678 family protein n=1 Tax=Actinocrinis puniceicyclus TaxID=977794 RepID=A0A8J8BAB0_9ACTN|nr:TIGR02678 family protein [Actinocrinis puniceicyclus]MBS2961898.1 TIGR02678 family protein [Actinocrinis puniceicyclus]